MCGVPQKSVERTPTSGTGGMCCVTLWRHGVGTHDDLVPRSTSFGTVTLWDSRLVNVSRSQYLPNKRTLGAMRQKTIWCTGWGSSLSLTSHKVESGFAAGWRPPKSDVGKKTGDLATRRGRGDPARGAQDIEEGVASRCSTTRQCKQPRVQQTWRLTCPRLALAAARGGMKILGRRMGTSGQLVKDILIFYDGGSVVLPGLLARGLTLLSSAGSKRCVTNSRRMVEVFASVLCIRTSLFPHTLSAQ